MKLYPEHKTSLKYYAAIFLIFGFILLLCGTLFENASTELADHQETMYRQDQVHYWAGIPFIFLSFISAMFLIFQLNILLKLCICFDFVCVNIAIFVIVVEGPDWKKYYAKSSYYSHSSDIDYLMLKPSAAVGSNRRLSESAYTSAMLYSGAWVVVATLSILLGVEMFLTHLKVYCGVQSIYGYLTGYELIHPEITLKMAQPVEKFQCKGCQNRFPTPPIEPSAHVRELKEDVRSPPTMVEPPSRSSADGVSKRAVSPALSDASSVSNAFYVSHESDGITLVGYKPRRHGNHGPQLPTHKEEDDNSVPPDYYHFSRKHPSEMQNPNSSLNLPLPFTPTLSPSNPQPPNNLPLRPSNIPSHTDSPLAKDPRFYSYPSSTSPNQLNPLEQHPKSIPSPPPLPRSVGNANSRHSSLTIPSPPVLSPYDFNAANSSVHDRENLSSSIHKPTAFSPGQPKSPSKVNRSPVDQTPGKYPPVGDIFPPSTLSSNSRSQEKGKVSFLDPGNVPASNFLSSNKKRASKLETLF